MDKLLASQIIKANNRVTAALENGGGVGGGGESWETLFESETLTNNGTLSKTVSKGDMLRLTVPYIFGADNMTALCLTWTYIEVYNEGTVSFSIFSINQSNSAYVQICECDIAVDGTFTARGSPVFNGKFIKKIERLVKNG